jgi:geranylgeranyl reductase family protein
VRAFDPCDRLKSVDEIFDVAVVGAGPAGSVAAYAAATRGLRVALIDRQAFPRDKPCGDGIGPGAVHIAQKLGLDDIFSGDKPVHTVRVMGPDGSEFHSTIPSIAGKAIQGYVVPRIHFDKRLFDRAIGVGAHDYSGMKFVGTELSGGLRVVTLQSKDKSQRRIAAHLLVGADGANSVVRRALGVPPSMRDTTAIAMRAYAKSDAFSVTDPDCPQLLFAFSRDLLPSYAWVFPTGIGTVNIGVGGPLAEIQKRGQDLKHLLVTFVRQIRSQGIALEEPCAQRAHHLPHFAGIPKLAHPRAALIGDAASMINPASGEGIAYGMSAAASLIENLPAEVGDGTALDRALIQFEQDFRRTYRMHIASSIAVHRLMHSLYFSTIFIRSAQRDPVVLRDGIELLFGFGRIRVLTCARVLRSGWSRSRDHQ